MLAIESPLPLFVGRDGLPLDAGYIYFGTVNLNPVTSPVTVYWDAAGTQPVAQPVRTSRGLIVRSGTPAKVYASGDFSMLVKDSSGTQVVYERNSSEWQVSAYVDQLIDDLASTSDASKGAGMVGFFQSGTGAVARTELDKSRERVSPEDFGAVGDGVTDDSSSAGLAFTRAGSGAIKFTAGKTYYLANLTVPDGCTIDAAGVTFKKSANGYILSMGKRSKILGKPTFDGNYSGGKTGNSIVIAVGDNTPTAANQGRQDITGVFTNSDQYHVAYTVANKGWLSRLLFCDFTDLPANSLANVLWPDEPANGGNRSIIGGYSAGPVVNANGCDNGVITGVQIGGSPAPGLNEGVYFPNGTSNGAKKIVIVGNRFGISGGRMQIRGTEHQFKDNIVAGDVYLMNGVSGCSVGGNVIATGYAFVDQSLGVNYISNQATTAVTPSIVSGITLGNGTIAAEYARIGDRVEFTITFTLGSTTTITGTMTFGLPYPVYSGNTTRYIGQVWGSPGYTGLAYIETGAQQITVYNTASAAVWNATIPKTWAAGDVIRITGSYQI